MLLQAYRYQEEYALALGGFEKAALLDPQWEDPREEKRKLESYLGNTFEYIEGKVSMCQVFYHPAISYKLICICIKAVSISDIKREKPWPNNCTFNCQY